MGFLNYFIMGGLAYGFGWAVRHYILEKNMAKKNALKQDLLSNIKLDGETVDKADEDEITYNLKHPTILTYLSVFFIIMLVISALIGRYLLNHQGLDYAFIIINSIVATFVFSFGLIPEKVRYEVPD